MDKCPKCGRKFEIVAYGKNYVVFGCPDHREYDKILHTDSIFTITEADVWGLAEKEGIDVPVGKRAEVLYRVKKYLESYCYGGGYNIWDAVKDAIRDVLNP